MKYFLLILLSFFSCTKAKELHKNQLNIALTSNIATIDPAISYDTVSSKVVYQIFESLYEYNYLIRPYQIKPLLAKDLPKIENHGLKYTIKIKENIFYHPSIVFKDKKRAVTAKDFINQFKRIAFSGTNSSGWWLFDGKIVGINKFRKDVGHNFENFEKFNISGLSAPDDHTLVINLTKPYPQLLSALSMCFTSPAPIEVIRSSNNDLNSLPIGTGPYIFEKWNKSSLLILKKNPSYHDSYFPSKGDRYSYENNLLKDAGKKLPFIDQINFKIIEESQTRWLNFLKGNVDLIVLTKDNFSIALDKDGALKNDYLDQKIKLQVAPTLTYWWLSFNMSDPLIGKNLKLRQAFSYAINIDEYIKKFTNNIALKANSLYPPGVPGYSPTSTLPYYHDKAIAKRLLAEAGYPNGEGLPIFNYDVRGSSTVSRQMAEFVQKELSLIGINIKINLNTFPGFLNKSKIGNLQIWQGGWTMDYPDPENVVQLLISKNHPPGTNTSYYQNKEVDELYNKLSVSSDEDEIQQLTSKIESLVNKDLPWIMQFYSRNYILHHGHVKNYRQSDLIMNNFKYLKLE